MRQTAVPRAVVCDSNEEEMGTMPPTAPLLAVARSVPIHAGVAIVHLYELI
jgi:hypothetical protein